MTGPLTGLNWIAADWGTTRLRVWALDADHRVLAQGASDKGMGTLDPPGFAPALLEIVGEWLGDAQTGDALTGDARAQDAVAADPASVPVVICGMAGARTGWAEAAYRAVPCAPLDASDATSPPGADPRLAVRILPGLSQSSPPDVMRGEETQIAGVLAALPGWTGVICLPGTHSKWAWVEAGRVTAFRTFMTGEVFALLSNQSVLRHSLGSADTGGDPDLAAFDAAAASGAGLADLFSIRAAGLLQGQTPAAASGRLSGLLIGAELATVRPSLGDLPVALVGAPSLTGLYARALAAQDAARSGPPMGTPLILDGSDMVLAGLTAARVAMNNGTT